MRLREARTAGVGLPPAATATRVAACARALGVILSLAAASPAAAASPQGKLALYGGDPVRGKIAADLLRTAALMSARASRSAIAAEVPHVQLSDAGVALDVRLTALTPALTDTVRALGFRVDRAHLGAARLALTGPPDGLESLAALPEVTAIHPRYAPRHRTGSVADQADVTMRADQARAALGVDGSGVRVGILSDSFGRVIGGQITGTGCNRTLTGSRPQGSGDLPATVQVLDTGPTDGADEGAAMGELVHDIAPGAAIQFRTTGTDEADMADGVDALRACGASVLVDDVLYLSEPMFQDGLIAAAEERAVAAGLPVFSAAGNEASFGVLQAFNDTNPASEEADQPTGVDFTTFANGSRFARVTVPGGCAIDFVLQWNEPFSGTLGPGASTDLDLYVYDRASASGTVLASGVDSQGCSLSPSGGSVGGDPLEIVQYANGSRQPRTVYVAIDNFCGAPDVTFRLVTFPDGGCEFPGAYQFDQAVFHDGQIYGHPAAADVMAVAAADYLELDTGGAFSGDRAVVNVETYSSLGGDLPYFFDAAGVPLPNGPLYHFKPEITAPDGTNTTFFGNDRSGDADAFPNFFGTSAAAPHAAAVAALMLAANPLLTPADVRRLMAETARDIESPGLDPLSGAGSIDALAAVGAAAAVANATPTATPDGPIPGDCAGVGRVTIADLILGVRIALGEAQLSACPSFDIDANGTISIDELIAATAAALRG
jgi:subtilisin family serine protease